MDFSVTYTELVNIAIPQVGVVNFQALHLLLQGILEHIHLGELKKVLSGNEDFLQTSQVLLIPREGDAQPIPSPMKRIGNVFDHVLSRMDKVEAQLASMKELPSTTQLLEASHGSERPVKDLWNFIKIRKMAEGNAEAIAKVMQVLQELLSNLNSTQVTVEKLRTDTGLLKDQFEKVNADKCDALVDDLRRQNRRMTSLQHELTAMQNKMSSLPKSEELVLWSGLHEAMFPAASEQQDTEMKPEGSLEPSLQEDTMLYSAQPLPEAPEPQRAEYMETVSHLKPLQPIQGVETLQTPWHTEVPGTLLNEEPKQAKLLPGAQEPQPTLQPAPQVEGAEARAVLEPSPASGLAPAPSGAQEPQPRPQPEPQVEGAVAGAVQEPSPAPGLAPAPRPRGSEPVQELQPTPPPGWPTAPPGWPIPPPGWPIPPPGWPTTPPGWPTPPPGWPTTPPGWPTPPPTDWPTPPPGQPTAPPTDWATPPPGWPTTPPGWPTPPPGWPTTPPGWPTGPGAWPMPTEGWFGASPWPFLPPDFVPPDSGLSGLLQPGHPQYPYSRAPPPAKELGSAWPRPLQPYKSRHSSTTPSQGVKEKGGEQFALVEPKDKAPKEKPPKEKPSKAPRSALQRMRTTAAIAAAAAAAYAAAANSAAQAAQAAAKRVKDAPATKMASLASATASAGPMGVFMDDLGAGTSRGATSFVDISEDVNEDNHYYSPPQSLTNLPFQPSLSSSFLPTQQAVSAQDKKKAVEKSMSYIATLPARHDSIKEEFAQLYSHLQQHLNYIANAGASAKLGNTVDVLQEKMRSIQMSRMKTIQDQIKNLQVSKMDKSEVEQELKEKADRITLARKASRVDLETLAVELKETMHGLLLKFTTYEEDWKKAIEELAKVVSTKLVHSDLDGLKKEMAEVWEMIKRLLLEGFRFDPDSAAGFRKKLFERVKCISCDRPVEMTTGPHLITIRRGHLLSQLRPASANSYEYLQREQMREQQYLQHVQDLAHSRGPVDSLGSQQEWGDGPRNACLSTIYPYGDPQLLDYDTAEVDILGVDGILYKGRMHTTSEVQPALKEHAVAKGPRPPSRNLGDRVQNGALFGAIYPSLFPPLSTGIPTLSSHLTVSPRPPSLPPRPPSLPLMPLLPRLIPTLREPQQAPGSARHWKSLRFEVRGNIQSKEGPAGP
ncbi:uncharacterized protein C16orf96 homolog [Echinops telfairi]|uniref:Uncharacterized protein C16orf96 homolog n=1 Tax=Echinops telfairi TaxID=9371 RepID=A0AC55CP74_ECHTE|nr:uncharacterized protein C16orf96 homolog [Echinops telfairi]